MSCCGSFELEEKPDGECPECGMDTFEGQSTEGCSYSPTECEKCGYSPCDGSC